MLRLQEIIDNHIHKDELVGDYLIIPIEKIQQTVTNLENLLITAFDVALNNKHPGYTPLKKITKVLQVHIENNNKKYNGEQLNDGD